MKFSTITAIIFATLFIAPTVQARETRCMQALSWQREGYAKAHLNVTEANRNTIPKPVNWIRGNNSNCKLLVQSAKKLRLAESKAWKRLRLQPAGVKWIIRRQFRAGGNLAVHNALSVVSCESSFHYDRVSSTGDTGTWQINWVHHLPERIMRSPELSTAWAWRASDHGRNFSPTWVCATRKGIA